MQFRFKNIFRYEFFGTLIFHSPAMKKKTQMTKTIYVRPYVSSTMIRPSVHPFDPTTVDRRLTKALHRLILKLTNKIKFHFLFRFDSEGVCMHAMFDVVCFCFQHTKKFMLIFCCVLFEFRFQFPNHLAVLKEINHMIKIIVLPLY